MALKSSKLSTPWGSPPEQVATKNSLADIMREQETASARRPTDIDEGDFMDDATLEAYLQALQVEDTVTTSEVSSHTVAAQPVNSQEEEDRLLAVCLQAAESDDYITQISYLNTAHTSVTREHESVRVLPLASVLAQQESDYVHKGSPQVRSSEWKAAQALDRKANLRKDPHLDTHNDQSSFSRHEPLLRALRSAEYVSELEGGGDVAGSGLLLDPSVAQDLRAFDKKQWKQQKSKSSDRRQKQKAKKSTAPVAGVVVVAEVEEVGVGVAAADRGVLKECVEPGDCGVQDERDDPIC